MVHLIDLNYKVQNKDIKVNLDKETIKKIHYSNQRYQLQCPIGMNKELIR